MSYFNLNFSKNCSNSNKFIKLILILSLCVLFCLTYSKAATIYANDTKSIQQAINEANDGDTINISADIIYYENVTVNKSVNLVAYNSTKPKIVSMGIGINITGVDYVNISGLNITSQGNTALYCENSKFNNFSGNIFASSESPVVDLNLNSNSTFNYNIISSFLGTNIYGLSIYGSQNNTFIGNNIASTGFGILIGFSGLNSINNLFVGNNISSGFKGISLETDSNNNNFTDNSIIGDDVGVGLNNADQNSFLRNNITSLTRNATSISGSSSNNIFISCNISGADKDVSVNSVNNNSLVDCNFLTTEFANTGGINFSWYLDVYVFDSLNFGLNNMFVNVTNDSTSSTFASGYTNNDGFIRFEFLEYWTNGTNRNNFTSNILYNVSSSHHYTNSNSTLLYLNSTKEVYLINDGGWNVTNGTYDYTGTVYAIQLAIDDTDFGNNLYVLGNTSHPYSGIVVDRSVNIISLNNDIPKVVSDNIGINITEVDNVNINGLNITGKYYGFYLYNSDNNFFTENIITATASDNAYGVLMYYCDNNNFTRNNITSFSSRAMHLRYCESNTIYLNNITSLESQGIYLLTSSYYNTIEGNIINADKGSFSSSGSQGILLSAGASNNEFINNIIFSGNNGIHIQIGSNNNTIYGNNITSINENGIYLSQSSDNNFSYNNIISGGHGSQIRGSSNSNLFYKNNISATGFAARGVYIENSDFNNFTDNDICGADFGVYLFKSNNNIYILNKIECASGDGGVESAFFIYDSSNSNIIIQNIILSHNVEAVYLYKDLSYNNFSKNTIISSNSHAVHLEFSVKFSYFTQNNITSGDNGILIEDSEENNFYENNITADTVGISFGLKGNNNVFYFNNITSKGSQGIYCSNGDNNTFDSNKIIGGPASQGVYIFSSSKNIFTNNTIVGGLYGLQMDISVVNVFIQNNITSLSSHGIVLKDSELNIVYSNITAPSTFSGIYFRTAGSDLYVVNSKISCKYGIYVNTTAVNSTINITSTNITSSNEIIYFESANATLYLEDTSGNITINGTSIVRLQYSSISDFILLDQNSTLELSNLEYTPENEILVNGSYILMLSENSSILDYVNPLLNVTTSEKENSTFNLQWNSKDIGLGIDRCIIYLNSDLYNTFFANQIDTTVDLNLSLDNNVTVVLKDNFGNTDLKMYYFSKVESQDSNINVGFNTINFSDENISISFNSNLSGSITLEAKNTTPMNVNATNGIIYLDIVSDVNVTNITITWTYTDSQLDALGISEDDLTFYYWDGENWVEIDTQIDKDNNKITAELDHFSYYAVGATDSGDEDSGRNLWLVFMIIAVFVVILLMASMIGRTEESEDKKEPMEIEEEKYEKVEVEKEEK